MIYYWNAGRKFIWMAFGCFVLIAFADYLLSALRKLSADLLIIVIITVIIISNIPVFVKCFSMLLLHGNILQSPRQMMVCG